MTPELAGRVVAVTGTSQGIGAGIVECCLGAGASVLGVSRRGSGGPPESDAYLHLALDITDDGAPPAVLEAAVQRFGRVDALVNNAGLLISADCWELADEDWDRMFAINLTAPFLLSQAFARRWRDEDAEGTIVNICSIESEVGWADPPQAGYAATKGALLSLTRALALDLADLGVRCVAIGPGVIATEMAGDSGLISRRIPLGRFGTPAEIGDATVFLISDQARYVTGEILFVDGGYRLP